jgi:hypothetical protein
MSSSTMRIRFAPDMPVAAVEVLSPDLQTITQVALGPGGETSVEVPSEASFIRIHLPSGRSVTVRHSGDLNYVVSKTALEGRRERTTSRRISRPPKTFQEVRGYHQFRSFAKQASMAATGSNFPPELFGTDLEEVVMGGVPVLPGGVRVEWNPSLTGRLSLDGRELAITPAPQELPYTLRVTANSTRLVVSLPGSLDAAYVRVDEVPASGRVVSIRVSTRSDTADTMAAYLTRADYYAAEAMAPWADQAGLMLHAKGENPYAAAVGAYLLLRLERYDLMRDWARNLANWFPFLPDGCVIWAWQSIRERSDEEEATKYLLEAAKRGLPLYTEGLRLLSQGLLLSGEPGREALAKLDRATGHVLWSSPFVARLEGSPSDNSPTTFDVDYMPVA